MCIRDSLEAGCRLLTEACKDHEVWVGSLRGLVRIGSHGSPLPLAELLFNSLVSGFRRFATAERCGTMGRLIREARPRSDPQHSLDLTDLTTVLNVGLQHFQVTPDQAGSCALLVHSSLDWLLSLIHISEPTRLLSISYAVFCLKKKKNEHIIYSSLR
eukprot:TRINITY_DN52715_c0_g1_i1.p1 TRINITY_DN52715_c0_g1~~TRINITY_DN52715_c0_g1_i1.p1  ORF type:complete len:158 (-),score=47.40 TRINITY_DN52715_c0_g1_i1:70-543(-)